MAKIGTTSAYGGAGGGKPTKPAMGNGASTGGGQGTHFTDRNLKPVSPASQQFEPTAGSAIRLRAKMGGIS